MIKKMQEDPNEKMKLAIIKSNLFLTPNDLKRLLKEDYPDITNEEVRYLIMKVHNEIKKMPEVVLDNSISHKDNKNDEELER